MVDEGVDDVEDVVEEEDEEEGIVDVDDNDIDSCVLLQLSIISSFLFSGNVEMFSEVW